MPTAANDAAADLGGRFPVRSSSSCQSCVVSCVVPPTSQVDCGSKQRFASQDKRKDGLGRYNRNDRPRPVCPASGVLTLVAVIL